MKLQPETARWIFVKDGLDRSLLHQNLLFAFRAETPNRSFRHLRSRGVTPVLTDSVMTTAQKAREEALRWQKKHKVILRTNLRYRGHDGLGELTGAHTSSGPPHTCFAVIWAAPPEPMTPVVGQWPDRLRRNAIDRRNSFQLCENTPPITIQRPRDPAAAGVSGLFFETARCICVRQNQATYRLS